MYNENDFYAYWPVNLQAYQYNKLKVHYGYIRAIFKDKAFPHDSGEGGSLKKCLIYMIYISGSI